MPFFFIIVGLVMVISAVRGTHTELLCLLRNDFRGHNNFVYWTFAILVLGALGYIKTIQPATRMFMALIVVVLFLKNEGVFQKFQEAISGATGSTLPSATSTATK